MKNILKFTALHLSLAVLLTIFSFGQGYSGVEQTHNYIGKVGTRTAYFTLTWKPDKTVVGSYICPGGKGISYQLAGDNFIDGVIRLNEFTAGNHTARLFLKKKASGGAISWSGTMENLDGRVLNVSFHRHKGAIPAINAAPAGPDPSVVVENIIENEVERRLEQERAADRLKQQQQAAENSIELVVKNRLEQQLGSPVQNLILVRKGLTEHEGAYIDAGGTQRRIRVVHDLGAELIGGNLIISHE